ncbi:MAG: hypothetical protein ACI8QC_004028 [Planctomycetota bacterium]|jgi:hypothetical protein
MNISPLALGLGLCALALPASAQNDECVGAVPLTNGTTIYNTNAATNSQPNWPCAGGGGSDIWFSYLAYGGPVEIQLCGSNYDTAIQVFSGTCGSLTSITCNDDSCGLDSAINFNSVAGQTYYVRIGGYSSSSGDGIINLTDAGPQDIGSNYCMAVPNSTGQAGEMSAFGTQNAIDNDVTLNATMLPANQFGYFIASMTPDFIPNPGGSMGNLCVSGSIGRLVNQIGATTGGEFSISLDLTSIPQPPMGTHSVAAGETWHFQFWHRDAGGTNNFTDGLAILFN